MSYDLLITRAVLEGVTVNLAVNGEVIAEVGPEVAGDAKQVLDAGGCALYPGVIDTHVHFNEPGRTHWEGFASGSRAFAAGGGTLFFDMPLNSTPTVTTPEAFDLKLEAALASSITDFGLWGGITPDNLKELEALAEKGIVGYKAFLTPSGIPEFGHVTLDQLEAAMSRISAMGGIVAVHAEDPELLRTGKGGEAWQRFANSRPPEAEISAVRNVIDLSAATGCKAHIVHVSCPKSLQMIQAARANGVDISAEICAHHLLLDETAMAVKGVYAKCAPPLRSRDTVEELWESIELAQVISSDHSPAPPELKLHMPFQEAWGGISGVQHTLPLLLTEFLLRSEPLESLTRFLSGNAVERFRLPTRKGRLQAGADADFCLVDFDREELIRRDSLLDRHGQNPYVGHTLLSVVTHTFRRGELICRNGEIVATTRGKFIRPEPS